MDISLEGKVAVVCGSTQGIGFAAAKELALLGAECILFARNENSLKQAVGKLANTHGQQHSYKLADFTSPGEVQRAITDVVGHTRVHILVNNTGGPPAGPIKGAPPAAFMEALEQHIANNQLLLQSVLPGMQAANYGRIINVISTSVKVPLKNLGVSNTVRLAVAGWAKSWANEMDAHDITINNVLPGFTKTARLDSLIDHMAKNTQLATDAVAENMQAEVPLKRFATPEEVAAVIAFLATPAAGYVNGASIPVDGGRTGSL